MNTAANVTKISITAPKLGKLQGSFGWLAEELSKAKPVLYTAKGAIALGIQYGDEKPQFVCGRFPSSWDNSERSYQEYKHNIFAVFPQSTYFQNGLVDVALTGAAWKLADKFIDECVNALTEVLSADQMLELEIIIHPAE